MKIDQASTGFQPITVTVETADEAAALHKMLARTRDPEHLADALVPVDDPARAAKLTEAMYGLYCALAPQE